MNQKETTKESERLIFSPRNTSPTLARWERERESDSEGEREEGSGKSHRKRKVKTKKKLLRETAKTDERKPLPAVLLPKHIPCSLSIKKGN